MFDPTPGEAVNEGPVLNGYAVSTGCVTAPASVIRSIEDFDQKIVKPIFEGIQSRQDNPEFRLVVCMDHFTPISIRTHSDNPVPVLLYDSRRGGTETELTYSEANGEKSSTLLPSGKDFFSKLLQGDNR
jgi:2,3-bisphosphoglycerate-independent phosphoglycerate mutase